MLLPFDPTASSALVEELDDWAKRLDERIVPHRWEGRLRRSLEAEAVAASTSLEGVAVTADDALRILAGDPPDSVPAADQALVRGYRDAMTFVQRRADDGALAWNRELLVGVQDRVAAGDRRMGAGRLRTRAAWVTRARTGEVVFEPPDAEAVPELVDRIGATVESADWHPAVAAAWVHVAVAAVHPFQDGNGRTARVLASLAMYRGGFRHPAFTSLEEWWGRNPDSYYRAFDCLGARFALETDVTPFVTIHVEAQVQQARELALRQQADGLLWTALENLLDDIGLPLRLANALYDLFYDRGVTARYYRSLADTSPATARNDLALLAAAGLAMAEGRTRGRHYDRGPELHGRLGTLLGVAPDGGAIARELLRRAPG
ncbi:MAG: hypothetical protein GXY03_06720 [Solirubrobacterales bacterium]|nr:hypothetical protein [Solirubrobacterales bacterium]